MNKPSDSRAERRRKEREARRGGGSGHSVPQSGPSSRRWGLLIAAVLVAAGVFVAITSPFKESERVGATQESGAASKPKPVPRTTPKTPSPPAGPKFYGYRVVESFPHDPRHYCQGLVFHDGLLYEGTGHYGESILGRFDLDSGEAVNLIDLEPRYFGEGVTIWKDKIFQLTWKSNIAFVYDRKTFKPIGTFQYPGEGWGLTHDDQHLILSDGTATLRFLDPTTFKVMRRLTVTDRGGRLRSLNELEYIDGEIYANIWKADQIARISPKSGRVVGWIDLTGLYSASERLKSGAEVLNGIAYDRDRKRLLVTGKYWPRLYHIELMERKR